MPNPSNSDSEEIFEPDPIDPKVEGFLGQAIERIRRMMMVFSVIATAVSCFVWNWKIAIGVLLGCVVSYVNFYWLERALSALADRATASGSKVSSTGTVFRFLLRYVFIGVGAYVIFTSSPASLYGFLGGLSLTVAAILCEAAYEGSAALRAKI